MYLSVYAGKKAKVYTYLHRDLLLEGVEAHSRVHFRVAVGRQRVVRAGSVVAHRLRREVPEEDGAGEVRYTSQPSEVLADLGEDRGHLTPFLRREIDTVRKSTFLRKFFSLRKYPRPLPEFRAGTSRNGGRAEHHRSPGDASPRFESCVIVATVPTPPRHA